MNENILTTTKKMLGLDSTDTSFDVDILLAINSAVSSLAQLGVAAAQGVDVTSATTYSSISTSRILIQMVKPYIYIKTRLLFDPPSSAVQTSLENQLTELEWRLYTWADLED